MKTLTSKEKHAKQWIALMQPDDLDFTDHLAFLSYTHQQMQVLTWNVEGKWKSGMARNTLRRESEEDMERKNGNCNEMERNVEHRVGWRMLMDGFSSSRNCNRHISSNPKVIKIEIISEENIRSNN
ncbi:unnamed protein product [Schistosoma margrebowiei]|uniref:Uncharacterized protein n=1 Tax=Schistosoma margrebowiei TaxID=48269 RepID=A0A183MRF6_9TREM|nr:unnamed protein product [Schistosoma margrebowiei]